MDKEGIKTLMKGIPLLYELDQKEIDLMAHYLEYRKEPEGSIIIKEGETADSLFFIVSGEVEVSVQTPVDSEPLVAPIGKGEVVGEMAMLSSHNIRSATVTAISEIELLTLSKNNYETLVEKHNKIAFKILKSITSNLCERIKRQSDQVVFLRLFG